MSAVTLGKAITQGLHDALAADAKVLVFGEDVGRLGGVFRITDGLQRDFKSRQDRGLAQREFVAQRVRSTSFRCRDHHRRIACRSRMRR